MKKNYLLESISLVQQKKGKIDNDDKISDGHISIKDHLVCEKIWDKFEMKNMGDYHDHYLKKEVLLLADVFEKFISACLKYYELDPCNYFSSPGLSWDAMLKMTGIELEKISDIDQYSSIIGEVNKTVFFFTKHILSLKRTKQ